jgi:hypothetical protein
MDVNKEIVVRKDGRFGDVKVICPCGYMDKFGAGSADPIKVANEHNDKRHNGKYLVHAHD